MQLIPFAKVRYIVSSELQQLFTIFTQSNSLSSGISGFSFSKGRAMVVPVGKEVARKYVFQGRQIGTEDDELKIMSRDKWCNLVDGAHRRVAIVYSAEHAPEKQFRFTRYLKGFNVMKKAESLCMLQNQTKKRLMSISSSSHSWTGFTDPPYFLANESRGHQYKANIARQSCRKLSWKQIQLYANNRPACRSRPEPIRFSIRNSCLLSTQIWTVP